MTAESEPTRQPPPAPGSQPVTFTFPSGAQVTVPAMHGQTVYDTHHAVMHAQTGRRQSHHKAYEDLTAPVRARYEAAGQAVAGPLEADNARLRDALTAVQRERDEAEDENRKLLRAWPRCPAGCNCRVGVEDDPDRNECGCDGPCNGGEGEDDGSGPTSQLHEGEWDDAVSEETR